MSRSSRLTAVLFGAYFAALLWITLFSRVGNGNDRIQIYPPFWSFSEIARGNIRMIYETGANILLFVPFGFLCRKVMGWSRKKTICFGLFVSLVIECAQILFSLGSLEVDDLFTNTIGAALGTLVPAAEQRPGKKFWYFAVIIFSFSMLSPFVFEAILHQHMVRLAANFDRTDGTKNLLVLNGKPGFAGNSKVYVNFLSDGCIRISGFSDQRAWRRIGELTLQPGTYSFSGLSETEEKTIAIELEYFNKECKKFIRLTPDIGPVKEAVFSLEEETPIRSYVGVYPDAKGVFTACPVIYRES